MQGARRSHGELWRRRATPQRARYGSQIAQVIPAQRLYKVTVTNGMDAAIRNGINRLPCGDVVNYEDISDFR